MRLTTDVLIERLNCGSMRIASGEDTNSLQDTLMGIPFSGLRALLSDLDESGRRNFWFTVFRVLDCDSATNFLRRLVIRPKVDEIVIEETREINESMGTLRAEYDKQASSLLKALAEVTKLTKDLERCDLDNDKMRRMVEHYKKLSHDTGLKLSEANTTIRTLASLKP